METTQEESRIAGLLEYYASERKNQTTYKLPHKDIHRRTLTSAHWGRPGGRAGTCYSCFRCLFSYFRIFFLTYVKLFLLYFFLLCLSSFVKHFDWKDSMQVLSMYWHVKSGGRAEVRLFWGDEMTGGIWAKHFLFTLRMCHTVKNGNEVKHLYSRRYIKEQDARRFLYLTYFARFFFFFCSLLICIAMPTKWGQFNFATRNMKAREKKKLNRVRDEENGTMLSRTNACDR